MRLGLRTFLWSFVPFAVLLLASFWGYPNQGDFHGPE